MRDAPAQISDAARRRGMRMSVYAQCSGVVGLLAFQTGFLLLYLKVLGLSGVGIMRTLSLLPVCQSLLAVPLAYVADRHGVRRVGASGLVLTVLGYAVIVLAGWSVEALRAVVVITGIIVFACGSGTFLAGWWALLEPLVPTDIRGRYFAILRISWQAVVLVFTLFSAAFLKAGESPIWLYQAILGVILVGLVGRLIFYLQIPELEPPGGPRASFREALRAVLRVDGYLPFCAYAFLLAIFTVATPMLFALVEKEVLQLGDDRVMWLGLTQMVGTITGLIVGGQVVDRFGNKIVFMVCHFAFGVVLLLFPLRDLVPLPLLLTLGTLHFAFGIVYGAAGIAMTTEIFALAKGQYKSLAIGVNNALRIAGSALSGLVGAQVVASGMLAPVWRLWGAALSNYDSVLLLFAGMVVLLVVTLGLVPSVVGKSAEAPPPRL